VMVSPRSIRTARFIHTLLAFGCGHMLSAGIAGQLNPDHAPANSRRRRGRALLETDRSDSDSQRMRLAFLLANR
jgi:hypothetical protein